MKVAEGKEVESCEWSRVGRSKRAGCCCEHIVRFKIIGMNRWVELGCREATPQVIAVAMRRC
jgi:hypothetical protein